ncbi:MAG: superoxide dismutase [Ni] [Candidatus Eisenbacteria bacterium]
MRRTLTTYGAAILILASSAFAHCQVPCGIYDDDARLDAVEEHITTIEKAITQIESLSDNDHPNFNQIIRWTNAKDDHADGIAEIVSWYFLQQRVKPVASGDADAHKAYLTKLTLLHEILVYSMKAKQSTDLANVEKLKTLLADFREAYSGK